MLPLFLPFCRTPLHIIWMRLLPILFLLPATRSFGAQPSSPHFSRFSVGKPSPSPPPPPPPKRLVNKKKLCEARNPLLLSAKQQPDDLGPPTTSTSIAPLLLLLSVYISNQWARSLIFYLTDFSASTTPNPFAHINTSLNLSNSQYGLLASLYFTILFSTVSLLAGTISDKFPNKEKQLTILSGVGLSLSMVMMGLSNSFSSLALSRFLTGVACAFTTPSGYKYLQNLYGNGSTNINSSTKNSISPDFASGLYSTAVYLGGAFSSLSILLDEKFGWANTSFAVGGFCALVTLLNVLFLPNLDNKTIQISDNKTENNNNNDNDNGLAQGER